MDGNLANEGAVEGADRRSATVTAKPAAAAKKSFLRNRKTFFYFKIYRTQETCSSRRRGSFTTLSDSLSGLGDGKAR